ncbi:hypothetical protein OS493_038263, partial [Desmophyllum pertusum]
QIPATHIHYATKSVPKCVDSGACYTHYCPGDGVCFVHHKIQKVNAVLQPNPCVYPKDVALLNIEKFVSVTVARQTAFAVMEKTAARTKKRRVWRREVLS